MLKNIFEIFVFSGTFTTLKFGISFSNFRKIAWAENLNISFFGPVIQAEKYGGKIFRKFEFFGFFRN